MSTTSRFIQCVFSSLVILSIGFSATQPQSAAAQGGDGVKRQVNAESGKVSFIGPENGRSVSAAKALGISSFARPADPAIELAKRFAPEFGLKNPERDLSVKKSDQLDTGQLNIRYQQNHEGIPVMGGELIVNTNENGDLYSMNGEVSPDLTLSTQPTITAEQAKESALQAAAKWYQKSSTDFMASEPELWIYDESLLHPSTRPAELVWRMEVTAVDNSLPVRELVLVNAQRGNISLHFNQVDTAWYSHGHGSSLNPALNSSRHGADTTSVENSSLLAFSPLINTYTANNTSSLPGSFLCNQSQPNCTNGSDLHADAAHKYAIGTFNLYDTQHNRNSINNSGSTIISTVHYCNPESGCPYNNAFWSGSQMVYGSASGWPLGDDVVAHEFTHGVTQYESNLFYYYQSGAINESFSDVWGEYYDQTNSQGNDTAGVKWQIGEDISGLSAIRSMSNPPAFGDPDMISSANYYEGQDDSGGVHTNSAINNKAVFLMVDGGSFNGKTVTALGWEKTTAIYYEAQTNLLISGADYSDLYYALQQACSNLIGQKGITAADCQEVKDAIDAVEMNSQPIANFNTDAPLCGSQQIVNTIFFDNLESGISNWTFNNGAYPRWQYDSPYGTYAHSGFHSLYADDYPATITDASARLISVVVPNSAYMHFAHSYGFESDASTYYDGGVLEYSTNGGSTWLDAGSLIDYNGYKGTLFTGAGNPLSGRSAFVGDSHGYISTRLNLASLAGQTVTFRWRMGLDEAAADWGWWVDDVRIFNCKLTISGNGGAAGATLSYIDGTPKTVTSSSNGSYSLSVSYNWSGSITPTHPCFTFSPISLNYSNVTTNQTGQNYVAALKPASGCTQMGVVIAGNDMGNYGLLPGSSMRESYPGVDNGPVKVMSTNGTDILAALRVIWKEPGYRSSYSEMMGLPTEQLSTEYWFPWYNNMDTSSMDQGFRIANVNATGTNTIQVWVGNTMLDSFTLGIGASTRVNYPVNAGPLRILCTTCTNNEKIIAALRVIWKEPGYRFSYSEMMGLPKEQLSSEYWFPWYNNATNSMNQGFRIANVNLSEGNTVEVWVGNTKLHTIELDAGASIRVGYTVDNGPIRIVCTTCTNLGNDKIIAALRIIWQEPGFRASYSEMIGLPTQQLSTQYWFPWYNNTDTTSMDQGFRIANVNATGINTIQVWVGNTLLDSFNLGIGESTRVSYAVNAGPLRILCTTCTSNEKIIAALRIIWKEPGFRASYSEMMGLPTEQLSSEYWFPWYNHATSSMDQGFRIAIP